MVFTRSTILIGTTLPLEKLRRSKVKRAWIVTAIILIRSQPETGDGEEGEHFGASV